MSLSFEPRIAVFDLDETLTRYDTFLPFVTGYIRHGRRRALSLWWLPFSLLRFWRWHDRSWVKAEVLRAFLGNVSRADLTSWVDRFVDDLLATGMRDEALTRLRAHQRHGVRVILASASFDLYVERVGQKLGIDEVLATRAAWNDRGEVTGMTGINCRHEEKLRRLKKMEGIPSDGQGVVAYSDSHADLPLLGWAEKGVAVCPTKRLRQQAGTLGLEVVNW